VTNEGSERVLLDHVTFKFGIKSLQRCRPVCGNGFLEAGEVCDDTSKREESGCKADCSGPLDDHIC